jgi:ABC-type uncharacterized transport system auxiliary subunit
MKRLSACLSAVLLVVTAGCSVLPRPDPVQLIDPRPEPPAPTSDADGWSLSMARPETDPARDSARVLVRTVDGRLQLHPGARWVAPAPDLLQMLALRWLRDGSTLRRVEAGVVGADRLLRIDLRRFELAESAPDGDLAFVVVADVRLAEADDAALVDRRLLSARAAVADDDAATIIEAVESALSALLTDLATWLEEQPRD